ncbi:MAG: hypothetical protein KF835_04595 [Xanthobacteraceae bacterium]|nr:hypothetical protein [Xanthobacteraceae bacterium]
MKALFRIFCFSLATLVVVASPSFAQKKVKTETVRDPKAAPVEIIRDLSRLPEPVRKKREEILAAARSGDIAKVSALIKENGTTISFTGESDAAEFWKKTFPDSEGLEALATLVEILEMPFVQIDKGTPQEMFVWPYFHALQLDKLTPEQRVELFRLVTAYDFREMQKFGSYNFFRAGIAPDGSWRFFVAGD